MLAENIDNSYSTSPSLHHIAVFLVVLFMSLVLTKHGVKAQDHSRLETVVFLSKQSQVLSLEKLQGRNGLVSFGPRPSDRTLIYLKGLFGVELTDENIGRILSGIRQIHSDAGQLDIRVSAAKPYPGSNALQIVLDARVSHSTGLPNPDVQETQTTARTFEETISEMSKVRTPATPDEAPVLKSDLPANSVQAILLISDPAFYDLDRTFRHSGVSEFGALPPAGLLAQLEGLIGSSGTAAISEISKLVKEAYSADGRADLEIWISPDLPPSGNVKVLIGPKQADMITTIPKERKEGSAAPAMEDADRLDTAPRTDVATTLQPWVFGNVYVTGLSIVDAEYVADGISLVSGEPIDLAILQSDLDRLNRSSRLIFSASYLTVSRSPPVLDINIKVSARLAQSQPILDLPLTQQNNDADIIGYEDPAPPVYRLRQYRVVGAARTGETNIISRMSVLHGEYIDRAVLRRDLHALNKSAHRTVQMAFEPVPGEPDLLDIVLTVNEAKAFRIFGSIEDSGLDRSGAYPIDFGLEWNKLGLWDQTISYKFNSEIELEKIFGHTLQYKAVSPLGHQFDVTGQFSESVSETIVPPSILFEQTQRSIELSGRYTVPVIIKESGLAVETYIELMAKDRVFETEADGTPESKLHNRIYQIAPGILVSKSSEVFSYSFDGKLTLSPGSIGSLNSDAAFRAERIGTRSDYVYANANLNFSYNFWPEWKLQGRFNGQVSSARLLSSEKLSAGGNTTVRGFDSGAASGDFGAVASLEVHLPTFDLPNVSMSQHSMRPFLFVDGAALGNRHALPTEGAPQLLSVGAGFNYLLGNHVSFSGNFGWQLVDENTGDLNDSKLNLRAAFNF